MTTDVAVPQSGSWRFAGFVSVPNWLSGYSRAWFRADAVAAVTLLAYLLPAGLGDASLAGLPPQAGLYACLFSGLLYWLFCSSRHTAITVTSAISLLIGTSLGDLAGGDPARYWALASATALLVAALAFAAWIVRAGVIVNFISETVLVGFKTGVALVLASTQFPKLFGLKGGHGSFWQRTGDFFSHLPEANPWALLVGGGALAVLVAGKFFLKNRPVALPVVIAGILVATVAQLDERGVKMLGNVPQGLPPFQFPAIRPGDVNELLPLAMACFLLGAVESVAIGRMFALKHGYRLNPNRELLALAGANIASGVAQGFPVSGGMSQSLVNESAGARTPLSGFLASLLMVPVVLFLSAPLRNLPQPVLAAVVLMAVAGLFKPQAWRRLWSFGVGEFAVALVALLGVLGSGMLRGVLIGAALSMLLLLRRASRPHVATLGRVPGTDSFGDVALNPENEQLPGLLLFRVDSAILYFNAEYVREAFLEALAAQSPPPRVAVWCLSTTPHVDLAGAEMLSHLREELLRRGVEMKLADARGPVRESLKAAGLEAEFGPIRENTVVSSVVRDASR
ncbi:MAG TPA: SulP family inorganic anion transporter [Tepidisphaeraceae bacterium]|nr:SulP family inorganic anion transporter [Tepidisphaeraceae bacterium]